MSTGALGTASTADTVGASRLVAVTGATGKQGGAVARHLLRAGWAVRALTRSPGTAKAMHLQSLGAQVVQADLNDAATLDTALAGCYGVFSVQNFYEPDVGFAGEIAQGKALADAAVRAGVQHLVQSTMVRGATGASQATDVLHFASKRAIEAHLAGLRLAATTLGTVWFMDNLLDPALGGLHSFDALQGTLGRHTAFDMLAVDDVGLAAATVFASPARWQGQHLDVVGDRLSVPQMRQTFQQVIGRHPTWLPMPVPNFLLRQFNPDFAAQLRWHKRQGWNVDLEAAHRQLPGLQRFATFLSQQRAAFLASRAPAVKRA